MFFSKTHLYKNRRVGFEKKFVVSDNFVGRAKQSSRGAFGPVPFAPLISPQIGFEPMTNRLTVERSTTELLRNNI